MERPWLILRHCATIRLEWQRKTMSIFSYSSHYPDRDLNCVFPENMSDVLTPEPSCPATHVKSVQHNEVSCIATNPKLNHKYLVHYIGQGYPSGGTRLHEAVQLVDLRNIGAKLPDYTTSYPRMQ